MVRQGVTSDLEVVWQCEDGVVHWVGLHVFFIALLQKVCVLHTQGLPPVLLLELTLPHHVRAGQQAEVNTHTQSRSC